jgi:hypothetical protein
MENRKNSTPDPANIPTFMITKTWRLISSGVLLLAFALADTDIWCSLVFRRLRGCFSGPAVWPGHGPQNWFGYDLCEFRELLGMHRIYYGHRRTRGVTSIVVSPGEQTVQINGSPVYCTALANGSTDITNTGATWSVVNSSGLDQTSNFTLAFVQDKGEGFLLGSNAGQGTYNVRASYDGVIGTAVLNVQ